jgi:hypothetical protein
MGSLSDYLELELLDHIFNAAYTPVATIYIGLGTGGSDTGLTGEPSGNNYNRKAITFGAATGRSITQNALVTFDQASGSWGTLTHYGIFDAATANNMLAWGQLTASKTVVSGNTPSIASSEVVISINAGECSDYLANKLLDFAFRNQAFAKPATYLGLATANLTDATAGSNVTECANGNNYARKQVNINGGAAPTWTIANASGLDNANAITMNTPTGSWGLVTACFIVDGATIGAGNILVYENTMTDQTPDTGDTVEFALGAFDVTLD